MNQLLIVDPTSKTQSPGFFALLKSRDFIEEFEPSERFILSYPVLRFLKPKRTSKAGAVKPEQNYFLVYDPIPLGKGAYGAVYQVLGTWHEDSAGNWHYKTKPEGKKRVIKTNFGFDYLESNHPAAYDAEYNIGHYIPHMGYKYPPTHFGDYSSLLMMEQPGTSLRSLLRRRATRAIHLSTADRLQISVNLLKAVEDQAHSIHPNGDEQIVIHQDLKPENTMIGAKKSVRLIDFGLAKKSGSASTRIKGTRLYMDPRIIEKKMVGDQSTDLYSLYRTIAELWGDTSRKSIENTQVLINCIVNNTFVNLFKGIKLLPEEQSILKHLIPQMTQYDPTQRPTRLHLLQQFELLLENRLIYDELTNAEHAHHTPLMEFRSADLFNVLQSKHAMTLIHRFKNNPECLPIVFKKLRSRIAQLSPEVLTALHQSGLNFAKPKLLVSIIRNIKKGNISSAQFMHLIHLGLPVDDDLLREWLHQVNPFKQEEKWVLVCRALYQSLPNAPAILTEQTIIDPFKAVFCRFFLTEPATDKLDRQNTRIINNYLHLPTPRKGVELLKALRPYLSPQSRLFAVIQHDYLQINEEELTHNDDDELNDIYKFLMKLVWVLSKKQLPKIANMPLRASSIKQIEEQLAILINALNSLDSPIRNVIPIHQTWTVLEGIEQVYKHLSGCFPAVQNLESELDQYYQWPLSDSMTLKIQFNALLEGYDHYNEIVWLQELMQTTDFAIPATSPIVQEFQSLSQLASLSQAQQFSQRAQACRELYSLVYEVLMSFQVETKHTGHGATRQVFFRKLHKALFDYCSTLRSNQTKSFAQVVGLFNNFELGLLGQIDTYPRSVFFIYSVLHAKMTTFDSLKNLPIEFFNDLELLQDINTFLKQIINVPDAVDYKTRLSRTLWDYFSCEALNKESRKQSIQLLLDSLTKETRPSRYRFYSSAESGAESKSPISELPMPPDSDLEPR